MHDPTEGGIATALQEMAAAAGARLRVKSGALASRDETREICDRLGVDPLGLLSSGALLAIVDQVDADGAIAACHAAGFACVIAGTVEAGSPGVIIDSADRTAPLPTFARDELARFYE
jgi:hydrogenase expression/formation protein HypE